MIKILENIGLEGACLYTIKVMYKKPTVTILLNEEKIEAIQLKLGVKQDGYHPHSFSILYLKCCQIDKTRKLKKIQTRKEVKLSLFADDIILHIRNPQNFVRKLQEICKVTEYSHLSQINRFSILQQQMYREKDHGYIPNHTSLKENKISRNKPNQGSKG